jgi:hypothetical protein
MADKEKILAAVPRDKVPLYWRLKSKLTGRFVVYYRFAFDYEYGLLRLSVFGRPYVQRYIPVELGDREWCVVYPNDSVQTD